ncbi:MAG: efflux RND transporter periplasmic adaptor subunit [Candidatus Xenobia bacterium]
MIWRYLTGSVLVLVAVAVVLLWPARARPAAHAAETTNVVTATLQAHTVPEVLQLAGTVEARDTVTLSTRVTGRITRLPVQEGDRVRAGQVLAQVDTGAIASHTEAAQAAVVVAGRSVDQADRATDRIQEAAIATAAQLREVDAQMAEARANLAQAEIDQHRASNLYRQDAVPRADLDHANTALKVARARLGVLQASRVRTEAELQQSKAAVTEAMAAATRSRAEVGLAQSDVAVAAADLPYGTIEAPFNGAVTRKLAWAGDLATPGRPLLEIQDLDHLRLAVSAPESAVRLLRPGQRLQVTIDALGRTLAGTVREIVPSADASTRSFVVRLDLPHAPHLVPGLYGHLELPEGTRQAVLVPQSALVERGQLVGVFVVQQDLALLRWIKPGAARDRQVEALSGLNPGDHVILSPPPTLEDGSRVRERSGS